MERGGTDARLAFRRCAAVVADLGEEWVNESRVA
jgi:hypothetical protein